MESTLLIIVFFLFLIILFGLKMVVRLLQRHPPGGYYQSYAMPTHLQGPYVEQEEYRSPVNNLFTYVLLFIMVILLWIFIFKSNGPDPPPKKADLFERETLMEDDFFDWKWRLQEEQMQEDPVDGNVQNRFYTIQLGAFSTLKNAKEAIHLYDQYAGKLQIVLHQDQFKLITGSFPDKQDANQFLEKNRLDGFVQFFELRNS